MTQLDIKKLVAVMVAAFPASRITAESVGVYERMLADLDWVVANAAVEQLIATQRWMPTVAEIRERCLALMVGEVRAGGEAWGFVLKAIARHGRNRTPGVDFAFSCPVTHDAVAALGWASLCDSENQVADRARFVELYDRLAIKSRRELASGALPSLKQLRLANARAAAAAEPRRLAAATSIAEAMAQIPGVGE